MGKKHFSSIINVKKPDHSQFDFVDINVLDDQELFIDPILISSCNNGWCNTSTKIVDDYFNALYKAYRDNDNIIKTELLSHAGEINYTKLGYGNGRNGHGNTSKGLIEKLIKLEDLITNINTISNVMDLPVLVKGFNEDGLSDMITNIIHKQLNSYTLSQLKIFGLKANHKEKFHTWDKKSSTWIEVKEKCYKYEDMKILLTPKRIVRKNYLFSADQFLKRVILERKKKESKIVDEKGKEIYTQTKRDLLARIDKQSENWRYDFVHKKTVDDETYLTDYHNVIKGFYIGKGMSDEELDDSIYKAN